MLVLLTAGICFWAVRDYYKSVEAFSQPQPQQETATEANVSQPLEETTQLNPGLSITYPDSQRITVRQDSVTVKGTCDTDKQLTANGNGIALDENGSFSFEFKLNIGENKLTLSNGVASFDYIVIYQLQILNTVYPDRNISCNGNDEIELSATALKDSSVVAVINGESIPLYAEGGEENSKFVTYKASYKLPSASSVDKNIGKVVFNAEYGDNKDSLTGGSVTIKAYKLSDIVIEQGQGSMVTPEISGNDVVNVLTQNTDHGKGKAMMLTVTSDYAETVPAGTSDDKNDPRYTPFPKGTVDYITGEFKGEEEDYYLTLSGAKVEKKKVTAAEGYIMPTNTVSAYKGYTQSGYSNAVFTMNWKVPFFTELKAQSYYKGYSGRLFNVSSFTASYIDITFKFTNAAEGSFSFPQSSVVSSAEWVSIGGSDGSSVMRIYLRTAGKFYGYRAYYSNDNRLIIQFKERPDTSRPTVVLDPGHGGRDCGAIAVNGTYEAHLNLRIAAMVKSNLEAAGCNVIITRTGDTNMSLDDRQAFARRAGGDIFVSLHNNSSPSNSLCGTEVYYYRANSKSLASSIHSRLASAWRGAYADKPEMISRIVPNDGGVRFYPFRVIRIEECPSVLIECGYLSHPIEAEYVCNDSVQQSLASAIANGIIDYFNSL